MFHRRLSLPATIENSVDSLVGVPRCLAVFALSLQICFFHHTCLYSQTWQSLNPGAGGAVQRVVLDPKTEGRAFLLSDVDGLYLTEDGGQSWRHTNRGLATTDTLTLVFGEGSRVYLGSRIGLHVSNDNGQSWLLNAFVSRKANSDIDTNTDPRQPGFGNPQLAIGSLAVDGPLVLAGLGDTRFSFRSRATLFRSGDGGDTFQRIEFGPEDGRNRTILQLAMIPKTGVVFAAVKEDGIWRSADQGQNWQRLDPPAGTESRASGVAVFNDQVFALYGVAGGGFKLFLFRGDEWTALDTESLPVNATFRNLIVDPRSTADQQRLLLAAENDRTGLYEVSVSRNAAGIASAAWQRIFYFNVRDTAGFDLGWEGGVWGNRPRPITYQYSPATWSKRTIWASGDQTLMIADPSLENWTNNWKSAYTSAPVQTFSPRAVEIAFTSPTRTTVSKIETYQTTGMASTVDFDVCQFGKVVISSKADHSVVMSWDGGTSWEDVSSPRRAKSQSCAFIQPSDGNLYAIANFSGPFDFGASGTTGELWAAKLNPSQPEPVAWQFLAGGNGTTYGPTAGLPSTRYVQLVADPHNRKRLYVQTLNRGTYAIDDFEALFQAQSNRTAVTNLRSLGQGPTQANERETALAADPNQANVLYSVGQGQLWKYIDGRWTAIYGNAPSSYLDIAVWDRGGTTWLAANFRFGRGFITISKDAGATWKELVKQSVLQRESLFDWGNASNRIAAVEAIGDSVFAVLQNNEVEHLGYGVFRIDIDANGDRTGIQDVTGNLPFPRSFRTKAGTDPATGTRFLWFAGWGGGTWRLPL
jgi:photosystem II stability/assembly factor-like uncharacterized protein